MSTIPHRELRNHSSEILRRVADGETIAVTNNGEIAAVLVPPGGSPLELIRRAGQARAPRGERAFRSIRRIGGVSTADILSDLRGDR